MSMKRRCAISKRCFGFCSSDMTRESTGSAQRSLAYSLATTEAAVCYKSDRTRITRTARIRLSQEQVHSKAQPGMERWGATSAPRRNCRSSLLPGENFRNKGLETGLKHAMDRASDRA